jgi:hypothetical protein
MCMVDYADPAKVFHKNERRARTTHRCEECGRDIAVGETYEAAAGLDWEGWWWSVKTCEHCMWARKWLTAECNGFVYAGVREDLEEHWTEEPLMRDLDLGRRIVGMRNRWRKKDGSLMPVPA